MPKVDESYFENKKNFILDAAFTVCKKKQLSKITMKEVIEETGLSQGGVYKYFANIDEIIVALLNRTNVNGQQELNDTLDQIITCPHSPETIICNMFDYIQQYVANSITGYGKIIFEYNTILITEPERYKRYERLKEKPANWLHYFEKLIYNYISKMIECGYFKPLLPLSDIAMFIASAADGILRDITLAECYKNPEVIKFNFDIKKLYHALSISLILMLGGSFDEIIQS